MIIQEPFNENLIKTYSNAGKYIIQVETGLEYAEAIDIPNKYTYIESEKDIEQEEEIDVEHTDSSESDG